MASFNPSENTNHPSEETSFLNDALSKISTSVTTNKSSEITSTVLNLDHQKEEEDKVTAEDFFSKDNRSVNKKENRGITTYSSTSSVFAEHTISDPNNDQVLYW